MTARATKKPTRSAASKADPKDSPKALPAPVKWAREFDRAVKLFHQGKTEEAKAKFTALHDGAEEAPGMAERARMFLRACDRRTDGGKPEPRQVDDLYYRAVLLTNRYKTDEAVTLLDQTLTRAPRDDRLLYLLAVNLFRRGERGPALERLREAIGVRALNRNLARNDPDFEDIREDDDFCEVVSQEP